MEGLPKLLPIWHDVTLKDSHVQRVRFDHTTYPDHGGVGIDVTVNNIGVQYEELKAVCDTVKFSSNSYCLPFLKPNKVRSLYDPCLGDLNIQKKNFNEFCIRFKAGLRNMKCREMFRKNVINAYEVLSDPETNTEGAFIPSSICELVKIFPEDESLVPSVQWSYTGGCLTNLSTSSMSHFLLRSGGRKLNKLVLTPIKESFGDIRTLNALEDQSKWIPCGEGYIYQIAVNSPIHSCCVKQERKYQYIKFDITDEDISYNMETFKFEDEISSLCMSKYIPGENLIILKNGSLCLQNVNKKKMTWKLKESLNHSSFSKDTWWGCSFGSHPRSVLYNDGFEFSSLDIRLKKPKAINIFSIPNPFTLDDERITLVKQLGKHDFQHLVATNFHLMAFDERYPQQPLMTWNHMLETIPVYCDVKPYQQSNGTSDYVIVIGAQESQDIAQFHLRMQDSKIQPFSLTPPLHLSKTTDCIKSLRLHCHSVKDKFLERISRPLIGLCVVPHSQNLGYTILQLTSLGDVFYQDFKPTDNEDDKAHRIGPGCVFKPPSEVLPYVKEWLEAATVKYHKYNSQSLQIPVRKTRVKKKEIIKLSKIQSPECPMCVPTYPFSDERSMDINDVCEFCGLDFNYSLNLLQMYQKVDTSNDMPLLSNTTNHSEELPSFLPQLVNLEDVSDPLSSRLLKPWLESGDNVSKPNLQHSFASQSNESTQDTISYSTMELERSTQLDSTVDKIITFNNNREICSDDEDIIPPSQDVGFGLYSSMKKKKKFVQKSVSGF